MHPGSSSNLVSRFGVFEADLRSGELRKNGVKVRIQELPFRALRLLLSRPNEVISRDEFRRELWSDGVFVDFDRSISSAINRLRDALGDSADNPLFIETVDRRGYRWIAPTHFPQPEASAQPAQPIEPAADNSAAVSIAVPLPVSHLRRTLNYALPILILLSVALATLPIRRLVTAHASPAKFAASSTTAASHHVNPEAEDFYLKGRYYWNKRTPNDLNKAVDYFTQSIVHDPGYAAAYVGLADCYNLLREYSLMPASEAYPRALAAAKKAVELDDHSSEAHASVAFASYYWTWDAATAEKEFKRSIELNPNNAIAHHWYATYLLSRRRFPESIHEIERAQALNPTSSAILADKGCILFAVGRRQEAIALLKQMEITEPKFISPHRYLKSAYFDSGDYPNYIAELRQEAALLHDTQSLALATAAEKGLTSGGAKGMFESIWVVEKKSYEHGVASPFPLAETSSRLNRKEAALQYLKIAFDRHDEHLVDIDGDPAFASLHDDPTYRELTTHLETLTQK